MPLLPVPLFKSMGFRGLGVTPVILYSDLHTHCTHMLMSPCSLWNVSQLQHPFHPQAYAGGCPQAADHVHDNERDDLYTANI